MELTLPFPPSVNHYYRTFHGRTLISRAGREYRRVICGLLARTPGLGGSDWVRKPPGGGRIALAMDAFPPDRRRRDLDNLLKSTQDSLAHAGVYQDDSQIDLLLVTRREPVPEGRILVRLEPLPLQRCLMCGRPMAAESEHRHDN
jgi:crossover junction endodeoxyribonuclease RusA